MLYNFKNALSSLLNQIKRNQTLEGVSIPNSPFMIFPTILGQGTFGIVYEGKNVDTNQKIAIKVCQYTLSTKKQIKILKKISHQPTAIKMYENYPFMEKQLIVLEHFQGSLRDYINQQKKVDERTSLKLVLKILKGMIMLKNNKILHRDIKPQNILLNMEKQQIKMIDFGQSLDLQEEQRHFLSKKIGTISYMSPQVLQFGEYSEKSEVWSLGIILYELITGNYPLQKEQYRQKQKLYGKIMNHKIVYPVGFQHANSICSKCLNLSIEKRISMQKLEELVTEQIGKVKEEKDEKKQKIDKILDELIQRIRLQKLNVDIMNNMVRQCQLLLNTKVIKLQQLNNLLKYIHKLKLVIQYSNTDKQIQFSINEFVLIDTVLVLSSYLKSSKIEILDEHLKHKGKKKSFSYYRSMKKMNP